MASQAAATRVLQPGMGDSLFHDVRGPLRAGYGQAWLVDPLGLHPGYSQRLTSVSEVGQAILNADQCSEAEHAS